MQTVAKVRSAMPAPTPHRRTHDQVAVVLASLCVVLIATRRDFMHNITPGTVVAVALAPVWLPRLARFRGARLVVSAFAVAVVSGGMLTWLAASDRPTSATLAFATSVTAMNVALGFGVVLWARTLMPRSSIGILFGIGLTLGISTGGRFGENPWRFGFAVPATVLLLGVAWRLGNRWLEAVTATGLALVTAASGGRSMFAFLMLAAVLVGWYALPRPSGRASSRARVVVLLALLGFIAYQGGQALILEGYLGEQTKDRTEAQIDTAGSLLLGARPELGATAALMAHRPIGYGSGTSANMSDLLVAKTGMARLNYDPNNGYVEDYMFGTAMELHSMAGDLWVLYGLPGLFVAALMAWIAIRGLSGEIAQRRTHALTVFLAASSLWSLGFGPFYTDSQLLALTLGLLVPWRDQWRAYSEKT